MWLEMQKNMFFSNHVFYTKNKCLKKKTVFYCFFQLQEDFGLINYSAIRVYL